MRALESRAAWNAADMHADTSWIYTLDDRAQQQLAAAVRKARDPEKTLFDYRRDDFDFGLAWPVFAKAFEETKRGRGVALVRGLPRAQLDQQEFELLTWAIGLHAGVARPQGKASQYLSAVRDEGTTYRSAGGRGYSSNAELDFHTDSADVVALTCYNAAAEGGMSLVTSSVYAYGRMRVEHPDFADLLHEPIHFSRQREQAPDEAPSYPHPIFDVEDDALFSKWNRNRVQHAQQLDGVPQLTSRQREALERFDALVRREDLTYTMYLEPGDLQLVNSHTTLHSRTNFVDHEALDAKRLLFRLWLATPDGERLPESWRVAYRAVEPRAVRGGIRGQQYDDVRRAFELRQAVAHAMTATA
jgi:alpha-ketoglutarate-dependent taurine dioxygenase